MILTEIRKDRVASKLVESKLMESKKYNNLDALIYDLVYRLSHTVLIVMDEKSEVLRQVQDLLRVPVRIIEFKTYVADLEKGLKSEHIHRFEPLIEPEGEITRPTIDTVYRFDYDVVEEPNTPRQEFEKKYGLPKRIQGYNYIRNEDGEVTGIVFAGYKSPIDEHIKEYRKEIPYPIWWRTRRPVDVSNLKVGMDVYVLDAYIDRALGKKTPSPKVKLKGKLREVYREDAGKETRIFPV
jgi:hypothetical protein